MREALPIRARRLLRQAANLQVIADELRINPANKGRTGRTIEKLLGLSGTDNGIEPDWYGVEVKGFPVSAVTADGAIPIAADKIFVCSSTQNPIAKLEQVLFVFFDYQTKDIRDIRKMSLMPELRHRLHMDVARAAPKSGAELLFLNRKGTGYAWYLREDFLIQCEVWD